MPEATILECLAAQPKQAVAILAPGRDPLSYARLCEQLDATIRVLRAVGVGPGDRVAVVLPNGAEMATACLAVAAAAACVPLNPEYKEEEFAYFLPTLRVKALIVQAGMASPAREVARRLGLAILELRGLPDAEAGRFEVALAAGQDEAGLEAAVPRRAQLGDVALVLHTSGTTARPKIVPLTQANLMASARNLCASLDLTAADRVLNMMPLFHVGGLVDLLLAPLRVGASTICTPNFSAPGFVACVETFDPSIYQGVPTMLQEILAAGDDARRALRGSSLRLLRSVSAPLPDALRDELERAFEIPVIEIYGMTEASGLIASNPLPPRPAKRGSVGVASGPELAILDEAGSPLGPGERGEVAVRGANVMAGYEADPAQAASLQAQTFAGSWLRTGDEGYLDADGWLFLTGRIKEIINRGGEKISPREIDELLAAHPKVAEAAAFALPHATLGEEVAVAVVVRPGVELTRQEIVDFLRPRLAYFKVPRSVHFVSEIPRTAGGKLQRTRLCERVQELLASQPEAAPAAAPEPGAASEGPGSVVAAVLAEMWARVLGVSELAPDDDFFDRGGDSLKAATFVNELQARWGEIVYVSALFDAPTLAEFEPYLLANCPQLVAKILGQRVQAEPDAPSRVDARSLAEFRAAIVPLAASGPVPSGAGKNPRAIFILGTPRSGSTLLRVMLGGSARLFAPPELFLLPFDDLAAREAWLARTQPFLGEGNLRAWMQLTGEGLEAAERELRDAEQQALATRAWYRRLQERAGDRTLVDKTPFNTAHPESLRHAEEWFEDPLYIHLVRHPYGMIRSFEEAKLAQLWHARLFRPPADVEAAKHAPAPVRDALSTRDFSETIWLLLHQNILDFLGGIPQSRQHRLCFEDLVASPQARMQELCGFLDLDFEPAMLQPQASPRERMTDALREQSRMIGDMKFHQHVGIDASAADQWTHAYQTDFLSALGWELAAELGYDRTLADALDREEFEI